jgi:hypothetical protein
LRARNGMWKLIDDQSTPINPTSSVRKASRM